MSLDERRDVERRAREDARELKRVLDHYEPVLRRHSFAGACEPTEEDVVLYRTLRTASAIGRAHPSVARWYDTYGRSAAWRAARVKPMVCGSTHVAELADGQPMYRAGAWHGTLRSWLIQEKVDGRNMAIGVDDSAGFANRQLRFWCDDVPRSDRNDVTLARAMAAAESKRHLFNVNYRYQGEALARPMQNRAAYARTPVGAWIVSDIQDVRSGASLDERRMRAEATRLGYEAVDTLARSSDFASPRLPASFPSFPSSSSCCSSSSSSGPSPSSSSPASTQPATGRLVPSHWSRLSPDARRAFDATADPGMVAHELVRMLPVSALGGTPIAGVVIKCLGERTVTACGVPDSGTTRDPSTAAHVVATTAGCTYTAVVKRKVVAPQYRQHRHVSSICATDAVERLCDHGALASDHRLLRDRDGTTRALLHTLATAAAAAAAAAQAQGHEGESAGDDECRVLATGADRLALQALQSILAPVAELDANRLGRGGANVDAALQVQLRRWATSDQQDCVRPAGEDTICDDDDDDDDWVKPEDEAKPRDAPGFIPMRSEPTALGCCATPRSARHLSRSLQLLFPRIAEAARCQYDAWLAGETDRTGSGRDSRIVDLRLAGATNRAESGRARKQNPNRHMALSPQRRKGKEVKEVTSECTAPKNAPMDEVYYPTDAKHIEIRSRVVTSEPNDDDDVVVITLSP